MAAEAAERRPPLEGELVPATALEAITNAEINQQIATARKYRRDVATFKARAIAMIGIDEEIAESCVYRLERKDRDGRKVVIEGPSVRLAEICLACWGNARA